MTLLKTLQLSAILLSKQKSMQPDPAPANSQARRWQQYLLLSGWAGHALCLIWWRGHRLPGSSIAKGATWR